MEFPPAGSVQNIFESNLEKATINCDMRLNRLIAVMSLFAFTTGLNGQQLSQTDKQIIATARSRYYSLETQGFGSATCRVDFDFSTVPAVLLNKNPSELNLLKATKFTIELNARKSPSVGYVYPRSADLSAQQDVAPSAKLLASLITGVFQTWPSKGLQGPIPPFNSEIAGVSKETNGYELVLNLSGGPAHLVMDKNFLVTEIVSENGQIDEHPVYSPSGKGLVYAGTTTTLNTPQNRNLEVHYELKNAPIDGLLLPSSVHLRVGSNIDITYALNACTVVKANILAVKPPIN